METVLQIVLIDAKPSVRKQILRELQIMHDCKSPYIISFYGAFVADPNICICMEFMDKGSLDGVYKKIGPIDIEVVGKVALAVLEGLMYLYDVHRIIHRGKLERRQHQCQLTLSQTSSRPTSS
jgi:mitogen-activated protein kinase kinase